MPISLAATERVRRMVAVNTVAKPLYEYLLDNIAAAWKAVDRRVLIVYDTSDFVSTGPRHD